MIRLDDELVTRMKAHGTKTYPEECCGVLLGKLEDKEKLVSDILEIDNSSKQQRERRFIITPEDYQNAEAEAARKGLDILGFYHSHPDHPARPSQFDVDHAFPSWSYIIIGVNKGKPAAMSSWVLREDRSSFDEEQLTIHKLSRVS